MQRCKQMVDTAFAELIIGCVALNKARALQNSGNVKKLYRIEASAEVGTTQRRANILDARKRRTAAHDHHFLGRARFGKAVFHLKPVRTWAELEACLSAAVCDGSRVLENVFLFSEKAFADGDEILIFVTELTANYYSARFIGRYGCDRYYMHNKQLQFDQRQQEIIKRMDEIQWTV